MKPLYSSRDLALTNEIKAHRGARGISAPIHRVSELESADHPSATADEECYEIHLSRDEDSKRAGQVLVEFFEQSVRPKTQEAEVLSPPLDRALLAEVMV